MRERRSCAAAGASTDREYSCDRACDTAFADSGCRTARPPCESSRALRCRAAPVARDTGPTAPARTGACAEARRPAAYDSGVRCPGTRCTGTRCTAARCTTAPAGRERGEQHGAGSSSRSCQTASPYDHVISTGSGSDGSYSSGCLQAPRTA